MLLTLLQAKIFLTIVELRLNNSIKFTTESDISHLYYENNTPERFRFKSSRSQMIFKIAVLKNFTKLTGQKLCWSLFLIKLQALRPATLSKRDSMEISMETLTQLFSCQICKILKNTFSYRTPSVAASLD